MVLSGSWLENLRIISAPGFIKYKQILSFLYLYMYVIKYKANMS